MKNSNRRLMELMSDPENRVLMILDTTGSVSQQSIEDSLFDIALAQKKFDPEGKRLVGITDEAVKVVVDSIKSLPIPPGALEFTEIPNWRHLSHGGYDSSPFLGAENQSVYKELNPTHLIYVSDMMISPMTEKDIPQGMQGRVLFFVLIEPGQKIQDIVSTFSAVGEVLPVPSLQEREAILAEMEAERQGEQMEHLTAPAPPQCRRVRI